MWMANLLFASAQIHFVQLRLRSARASARWNSDRHSTPSYSISSTASSELIFD